MISHQSNHVNEKHENRYVIVLGVNICRPEWQKVLEVWVYLLLAGVINSGGALVRDLSTQIWITRQRNLARSNLCVWYFHESKRECETSAITMETHMFMLGFLPFWSCSLFICASVSNEICMQHQAGRQKPKFCMPLIFKVQKGGEKDEGSLSRKYNSFALIGVCVVMIRSKVIVYLLFPNHNIANYGVNAVSVEQEEGVGLLGWSIVVRNTCPALFSSRISPVNWTQLSYWCVFMQHPKFPIALTSPVVSAWAGPFGLNFLQQTGHRAAAFLLTCTISYMNITGNSVFLHGELHTTTPKGPKQPCPHSLQIKSI